MFLFNLKFLLDLIFGKKFHIIKLKTFIKFLDNSKCSVIEIKPDDYLADNHFPNAIIFWNINLEKIKRTISPNQIIIINNQMPRCFFYYKEIKKMGYKKVCILKN